MAEFTLYSTNDELFRWLAEIASRRELELVADRWYGSQEAISWLTLSNIDANEVLQDYAQLYIWLPGLSRLGPTLGPANHLGQCRIRESQSGPVIAFYCPNNIETPNGVELKPRTFSHLREIEEPNSETRFRVGDDFVEEFRRLRSRLHQRTVALSIPSIDVTGGQFTSRLRRIRVGTDAAEQLRQQRAWIKVGDRQYSGVPLTAKP